MSQSHVPGFAWLQMFPKPMSANNSWTVGKREIAGCFSQLVPNLPYRRCSACRNFTLPMLLVRSSVDMAICRRPLPRRTCGELRGAIGAREQGRKSWWQKKLNMAHRRSMTSHDNKGIKRAGSLHSVGLAESIWLPYDSVITFLLNRCYRICSLAGHQINTYCKCHEKQRSQVKTMIKSRIQWPFLLGWPYSG
jgi:hypothetical protein